MTGPVNYNNGKVALAPVTHVIWLPAAGTSGCDSYINAVEQFFKDESSPEARDYFGVISEYCDASGACPGVPTYNGISVHDTTGIGHPGMSTDEIARYITTTLTTKPIGQNAGFSTGVDQTYLVFLGPGVDACTPLKNGTQSCARGGNSCGAFHTWDPGSQISLAVIAYSPGCPHAPGNHSDPAIDVAIQSAAHEQAEMITDPTFEAYSVADAAGNDEIVDVCPVRPRQDSKDRPIFPGRGVFQHIWNGHRYALQFLWSKNRTDCVAGETSAAAVTPSTAPSATASAPLNTPQPATTASPSPTPVASPSESPTTLPLTTLPASYVGTWGGTFNQTLPPAGTDQASLTLHAGKVGEIVGQSSYFRGWKCTDQLTLQSVTAETVVLAEHITGGPCLDGSYTLRLTNRTITGDWRKPSGQLGGNITLTPSDPTLPAAFIGNWSGTQKQTLPPNAGSYPLNMTLHAGSIGAEVGQAVLTVGKQQCAVQVSLISANGNATVLYEHVVTGPCVDIWDTLVLTGQTLTGSIHSLSGQVGGTVLLTKAP